MKQRRHGKTQNQTGLTAATDGISNWPLWETSIPKIIVGVSLIKGRWPECSIANREFIPPSCIEVIKNQLNCTWSYGVKISWVMFVQIWVIKYSVTLELILRSMLLRYWSVILTGEMHCVTTPISLRHFFFQGPKVDKWSKHEYKIFYVKETLETFA